MKEQLTQYVNLLFAGNDDVEEIRQEILQNTLDRYDDLIAQGKSPESAYRQAISGIGDINDILSGQEAPSFDGSYQEAPRYAPDPSFESTASAISRAARAIAIFLYIICPIPIIFLDRWGWDEIGVCITLVIVAIATALLILFRKKEEAAEKTTASEDTVLRKTDPARKASLKKSVGSLISTVGLVLYFIISFASGAWFITWLIFPIIGSVKGVVNAIIDMREDL